MLVMMVMMTPPRWLVGPLAAIDRRALTFFSLRVAFPAKGVAAFRRLSRPSTGAFLRHLATHLMVVDTTAVVLG